MDEFYYHPNTRDHLRPSCNDCLNSAAQTWRKQHPEIHNNTQRKSKLKTAYGLTIKQFDGMLQAQGRVCAICGTDTPGGMGRFSVDHDHITGQIRGLLCVSCNMGLGAFGDNPDMLEMAKKYLQRHT